MPKHGLAGAFIAILAATVSWSANAEESPLPDAQTFSVITYNVQFLPGPAMAANKRKEPEYRASRIAKEMSLFDIVALQETFHDQYREQILRELKEHWGGQLNVVISPTPEDRFNGGCLIATRLPILESNAMIFEHYSSPEEYGIRADGYAAKGVIHARIALQEDRPNRVIDVYVSHLEARADYLRPLQYVEFADFIRTTTDTSLPILLLGDFNTRGTPDHWDDPDSQYNQMMNAFNGSRPNGGIQDVWPLLMNRAHGGTSAQESSEVGRRIDYIVAGNPPLPAPQFVPKSIEVLLYQDPKVEALSDHNAVAAVFAWE